MKKVLMIVILLSVLSCFLGGCLLTNETVFGKVKVGYHFLWSLDGSYKKLPYNFCLEIDYGSVARLFRVDDEYVDREWDSTRHFDTILEGHFIKGYYDTEYLLLCEEKEDDSLLYWRFDFADETIRSYTDLDQLNEIVDGATKWFPLCNTNEEIGAYDRPTL